MSDKVFQRFFTAEEHHKIAVEKKPVVLRTRFKDQDYLFNVTPKLRAGIYSKGKSMTKDWRKLGKISNIERGDVVKLVRPNMGDNIINVTVTKPANPPAAAIVEVVNAPIPPVPELVEVEPVQEVVPLVVNAPIPPVPELVEVEPVQEVVPLVVNAPIPPVPELVEGEPVQEVVPLVVNAPIPPVVDKVDEVEPVEEPDLPLEEADSPVVEVPVLVLQAFSESLDTVMRGVLRLQSELAKLRKA